MGAPMISTNELIRRQRLPLNDKIKMSQDRIREWYEVWDGGVYVAFSGGKDSTVLLDIVRGLYPNVPAVFNNTGVEFPEIVQFVKKQKNVVHLRPAKSFYKIVHEHGYPVVSKVVAGKLFFLQNPTPKNVNTRRWLLTGERADGTMTKNSTSILAKKWRHLANAPFKIHNICCDILKKAPAKKYEKMTGQRPFVGTMATDSELRCLNYKQKGCNYFGKKSAVSTPLAFWTEKNIWDYIHKFKIPYSPIYDMGYVRTGCMFCMFGVHMEQRETGTNRFILMATTHPKQYRFCIEKLKIGEKMDSIGVPYI